MKTKRKTMVKKSLIVALIPVFVTLLLYFACSSVYADTKSTTAVTGASDTVSATTGDESVDDKDVKSSDDAVKGSSDNAAAGNTGKESDSKDVKTSGGALPWATILLILIGVLISIIINALLTGSQINDLRKNRKDEMLEVNEHLSNLDEAMREVYYHVQKNEKACAERAGIKTSQKNSADAAREDNEIDRILLLLQAVDIRLKELEKGVQQSKSVAAKTETVSQPVQRSFGFGSTPAPAPAPKWAPKNDPLEDKYNDMKRARNESGFIREYQCERTGIKDYQGRNADPNSSIILEKDEQGWFLILQDKYGSYFAVPVFDAPLKSRYYDMFSTIFTINETGSASNDFTLIRPARMKALGSNKYETMEKGEIII